MERDKAARDLEFEVESSRRKMSNLESRIGEFNILSEKMIQYEGKISQMSTLIQSHERERAEIENLRADNLSFKEKLTQARKNLGDYEHKVALISQEIDRLNSIV